MHKQLPKILHKNQSRHKTKFTSQQKHQQDIVDALCVDAICMNRFWCPVNHLQFRLMFTKSCRICCDRCTLTGLALEWNALAAIDYRANWLFIISFNNFCIFVWHCEWNSIFFTDRHRPQRKRNVCTLAHFQQMKNETKFIRFHTISISLSTGESFTVRRCIQWINLIRMTSKYSRVSNRPSQAIAKQFGRAVAKIEFTSACVSDPNRFDLSEQNHSPFEFYGIKFIAAIQSILQLWNSTRNISV